jgi:Glu-tRNA(Gln) amidotransferase subunit E-like FAD-binding protein
MKKYLLFAVGNFTEKSTVCYITDALSDVTNSDFLKYKIHNGSISIHFGSCDTFTSLVNYVNIVMSKCSEIHYLVEYTDNMSVKMDKNDAELFLILSNKNLKDSLKKRANESMTDSIKSKIDEHNQDVNKIITKEILDTISQEEIDKITNDGLLNFFDEIEDEDESIKKTLKKEYKLDDILDKITEKGISSLTKEEKEYLNKLSK